MESVQSTVEALFNHHSVQAKATRLIYSTSRGTEMSTSYHSTSASLDLSQVDQSIERVACSSRTSPVRHATNAIHSCSDISHASNNLDQTRSFRSKPDVITSHTDSPKKQKNPTRRHTIRYSAHHLTGERAKDPPPPIDGYMRFKILYIYLPCLAFSLCSWTDEIGIMMDGFYEHRLRSDGFQGVG